MKFLGLAEVDLSYSLLEDIEVDDESRNRISPTDAKTVINWLKETYKIDLPFPQSHQLHPKTNFPGISEKSIQRRVKSTVGNIIGITIGLVVLFIACDQFYSFINSNQHEYDFGQENNKPTPNLKSKHPISKTTN